MTRPSARSDMFDRSAWEGDYQRGVEAANRTISTDPRRVDFSLRLAEAQLAAWPAPGKAPKNGLTESQYARTRGFAETLREYREEQGS